MKKLLESLISCYREEDGFWDRKYLRILGVDILLRKKFRAAEVDRRIGNALSWTCDVTKVPRATGLRRRFQLAEVKMLKIFDAVCRKNDIPYYIAFGTLLGAYRHKGYIPWDDDVDVSVPREYRDRIEEALERTLEGTGFTLVGVHASRWDATLRFSHSKYSFLNLDVFYPFCFTEKAGREEDVKAAWDGSLAYYREEYKKLKRHEDRESLRDFRRRTDGHFADRVAGLVNIDDPQASRCTIGFFGHNFGYRRLPVSALYPFGRIEFEDMVCPSPRDPYAYLSALYDVYAFPPRFDRHGNVFTEFSEAEIRQAEDELEALYRKVTADV